MAKLIVKAILYGIDYFFLAILGKIIIRYKGIEKIHFSIDDVFEMIQREVHPICEDLCTLYSTYGLLTHLFVFLKYGRETLDEVPENYMSKHNFDFGPHQAEYIVETYAMIGRCKKSEYVRLHEYKANTQQLQDLARGGGKRIIYF